MTPAGPALGVLLLAAPAALGARQADSVTPLFRDHRPLDLVITADFKKLFKDRDTTDERRVPARLRFRAPEAGEAHLAIELATRGHSRLLPNVCDFPPLRVHLPPKEERPELFHSQATLKLTVNCKPGSREYEQYVLQEYLCYRIYNLFTEWSYRVRLARTTYIQASSGDTIATTYGFFVEDQDDLARRNGGAIFEQPGVRFRDVDEPTLALLSVFQYMIANTDWGLPVYHNIRVVKVEPGLYYPVPYDFDFSGIIKTPYAQPSPKLPIRSVRSRLYRGPCLEREVLQGIFARVNGKRDEIYAMHRALEGLAPKRAESALKYLDQFYATINNPGKADREFRYVCG